VEVLLPDDAGWDLEVETLIVGAGACGLVAALAAREAGDMPLVLEADAVPAGSTALSAGLIPAAGTRWQAEAGIEDEPDRFAADIQAKARGKADPALVASLAAGAGPAVEWLAQRHGLPFSLVDDFDYPGHSRRRMHGLPSRSGRELVDRLRAAAEAEDILIATGRRAVKLYAEGGRIVGVAAGRPDGAIERIGCGRLILACNGYGGSPERLRRHAPEIADAVYFGHPGNRGEALAWGEALGAARRHLGSYQGHGNVAHPHGILVTWATITEGGFQVNAAGERFWNEGEGYSEAARIVLAQPGGEAITVFDERVAAVARQFADYRQAEAQGAVKRAMSPGALARAFGLPPAALEATVTEAEKHRAEGTADRFGRLFAGRPLAPPWLGVRVTGALFHTQGGLVTDGAGRVLRPDGTAFQNLLAGGGAACGVSGPADWGYLSGNGLLSAIVLGHAAGSSAGRLQG
jgi:fumarate reductase flavoprotein subunit